MYPVIFGLYLICLYVLGARVVRRFLPEFPALLTIVGAFLIGTAIGVPITYLFSCLFAHTHEPILWGVAASTVCIALLLFFWKKKTYRVHPQGLSLSDVAITGISLIFSSWIMLKTFHGDAAGQLFVGSNNVFDFGHALGIIRSFSWGSNIPLASPFESGSPFFYHFLFYFFVAIWEYFGVPIVWAINIPSVLFFSALLILIYFLPQIIAKQKPITGWIAVFLTITNSSLTFWHIAGKTNIWSLPAYPFAGPFDGSIISIFVTLNNYVNQRHLAFSIALGFFLYLLTLKVLREKTTRSAVVVIGAVTGLLFLWNMAIFIIVFILISILMLSQRKGKAYAIFFLSAAVFGLIINLPNVTNIIAALSYFGGRAFMNNVANSVQTSSWTTQNYLWQNLGIIPFIAGFGYFILSKKTRNLFVPFIVLFLLECILASVGARGFDQKFYSFLIISINLLAAAGIVWLLEKKTRILKIASIIIFGMITISGIVDWMPIKNEFAFPIVKSQILPVISWIHANTTKEAVFVSYADIVDPVVLAGRKNYFGFFGNIGWKIRTDSVGRIYSGDIALAKRERVGYILVPRFTKTDFPYITDVVKLSSVLPLVYEDTEFLIFKVQ